ncbi:hypothetical protein DICPUDRAFT_38966 [Dictyostelium purpureum]|uniref:Uncharacterized protein n=1 Tax=Dictyostelium purpureum TaxID=5786 RepID=F0ZVG6_DICPU|nr:uncharacterized protein DICPUDRAFT_38966 [Dictyostelium purpureum]EGC32055.1 hypothetical protein DICPUDRAFT_38966 [Dictyostelium purpureum]|eukprot:XP_003291409.1 hypothetical protein DICPUDRAFT_38966 [Dictyostelium purpureum]
MKGVAKLSGIIGIGLFLHTIYSVLQHRKYLRLTDQPFEGVPLDIIVECIISLLLFSWGIINSQNLIPIKASTHLAKKSYDSFDNRPNFTTFNNRGKYINEIIKNN